MIFWPIKCQFEPIILEHQQAAHSGLGYVLCEGCFNSIIALAQQGKNKGEILAHLVGKLQEIELKATSVLPEKEKE